MKDAVLVTYSTRTGSTKGVSEFIGKTLTDLGESVDVLPMNEIDNLSHYSAVIAGSAIQSGKWLPEASEFREVAKIIGLCNDLKYQSFSTLLNLNSLIVNRSIHVITKSPAGMANTKARLSTFGTNVTRMR